MHYTSTARYLCIGFSLSCCKDKQKTQNNKNFLYKIWYGERHIVSALRSYILFFQFLFCSFRIYIYFCRQNSKHIIMKAMTLSPSSPVSAKYWSELKDLSNSVKLELITLLSSSVANSVSEPSSEKGWTKSFAGRWQDDRTAEEIIEDIRSSRNANLKELVL